MATERQFEIVELDDIDGRPAFFTERGWAADMVGDYETGKAQLPDELWWQGAGACFDPVAIVRVRRG